MLSWVVLLHSDRLLLFVLFLSSRSTEDETDLRSSSTRRCDRSTRRHREIRQYHHDAPCGVVEPDRRRYASTAVRVDAHTETSVCAPRVDLFAAVLYHELFVSTGSTRRSQSGSVLGPTSDPSRTTAMAPCDLGSELSKLQEPSRRRVRRMADNAYDRSIKIYIIEHVTTI